MEKVSKRKVAKALMLSATLVAGVIAGSSVFNEAQATGGNCVLVWDHGNPGCPPARLGNCCCC